MSLLLLMMSQAKTKKLALIRKMTTSLTTRKKEMKIAKKTKKEKERIIVKKKMMIIIKRTKTKKNLFKINPAPLLALGFVKKTTNTIKKWRWIKIKIKSGPPLFLFVTKNYDEFFR